MATEHPLCVYCNEDIYSPSFLYSDYCRKFSELESITVSNDTRLRSYGIVHIRQCSHLWHSICLFDCWTNNSHVGRMTRSRGPFLHCVIPTCSVRWTSWQDIFQLLPKDTFPCGPHLVKLSRYLMSKYNAGDPIVKDLHIPNIYTKAVPSSSHQLLALSDSSKFY